MWQLDNRTPFAAERGWVRGRDGSEIWLVAVKATFDIAADGRIEVSREQPPVLRLPEHHGDPATSSMRYDADLVLTKQTTDVLVNGHAYAPEGRSVARMDAAFKVGPVQKSIRVFGDRHWGALGASAPQPFDRMPIVYERAYGGIDRRSDQPERDWEWRNPVGTGFAVSGRNANGLALPNIEDPRKPIGAWSDRPAPVGFGPIASHWQPRVALAGTYDEHWQKTRRPLLAADLDDRFYQSAPTDQQAPDFLRGGEPVVLLGLTPAGRLDFRLPRIFLGFDTRYSDGSRELHQQRRLHTVMLEPDFPRLSLVWHSALPCHFKVHKLDRTIITLKTDVGSGDARLSDADAAFA